MDRPLAQRDADPARTGRPETRSSRAELGTTELAFLDLQSTAGNRAMTTLLPALARATPPPAARSNGLAAAVQRVHIDSSGPETEENLLQPYDAKNRPTKMLTPHRYQQDMHFDLTRGTDKVSIEVKIKFVQPNGREVPAGPKRDAVAVRSRRS